MLTLRKKLSAPDIDCMSDAARMIVGLNIQHYRELLRRETDTAKRQTIAKLLAEEEAKLAKLLAEKKDDN
jgi:hypothetical protein